MDWSLLSVFLFAVTYFSGSVKATVNEGCMVGQLELTQITDVPLIGSSNSYTFNCSATVSCDNTTGDVTLTVTGGNNINSTTVSVDDNATFNVLLTIGAPVKVSDAGLYTCTAAIGEQATNSTSNPFNVSIPTPTVTAKGSTAEQLSTAEVNCTVTTTVTDSFFVTVMWASAGSMQQLSDKTFGAMATLEDKRMFAAIIDNAGVYSCSAMTFYNGSNATYVMNSGVSDQANATVTITLLSPNVSVTSDIVPLGQDAMLTCTVVLANDSSSSVNVSVAWTPNNGNEGVDNNQQDNIMRTFSYSIASVSTSTAGSYLCSADISVNNPNILSSTASRTGIVYATDLSMTTNNAIRLDTQPYNNFTTICNLTHYPPDQMPGISFLLTDNNTMDSLKNTTTSDGNSEFISQFVTINDGSVNNVTVYEYTCSVDVTAANADSFSDSESVFITVRGESPPVTPVVLNETVYFDSAIIRWQVPRIAYTPEMYFVRYGMNSDGLNYLSSLVFSGGVEDESFLSATSVEYEVKISNLTSGVTYYYAINSSNTVDSVQTDANSFVTSDAPPSPPRGVQLLQTSTATSLNLRWSIPELPNGNITFYNYSCISTNRSDNDIESGSTSSDTLTETIDNLFAFTEYMCNVTASTSAGAGNPGTASQTTGQTAPSGPPTNFMVESSNRNPNRLELSWMPPQREDRNGIITSYSYNCSDQSTLSNTTTATSATINGLSVYTNYTCSVRAATIGGSGPFATTFATTGEDEPSEVRNLQVDGLNVTAFFLSWTEPETPNGIIRYYVIVAIRYSDNLEVYRKNSTDSSNTIISSTNLEKGVPYTIFVSGVTGGGQGQPDNHTNFTEQGTPGKVQITDAVRINGTAMNVSWERFTIVDAQGFFHFIVTLTPTESRKRQSNVITRMFASDRTSGIVTGLDSSVTYSVTVTAQNDVMPGTPSDPTEVPPLPEKAGLQIGLIIGILVAALVILILLVAVIILLLLVLRRVGHSKEAEIHENPSALESKRHEENGNELKLLSVKQDPESNERMQAIPIDEFADHVKRLHMNRDLGFEEEYESLKGIPIGSFTIAKKQENIPRNRFDNVYSYDDSRVVLPTNDGGSDYINASFINGYNRPKAYIAAQGPLPNTVVDFWRMIWEFQLPTVVMLTELIERGIEKCTCYFPRNNNETLDVGGGLKVTLIEQQQFVEYKYKKFLLLNTGSEGGRLDVTHYHFLAWPDHGVPADKTVMMAFARRVRQTHPPEGPPLIVHCSAGVGRTGTFIVLDTMMQRIEKNEGSLNIYELVADMRSKRTLMVQTAAQYIYTHDALSEYIICGDTSITTKGLRDRTSELSKVSEGTSRYQKQLDLLNQISRSPSEGHCSDSLSKQNVVKNRYSQVITSLPYNETRVRLRTTSGTGDYINASIVDGYKHRGAFLATQVPLESTVADLWRMVWESWSASIVMLCSLEEESTLNCYWPKELDKKCVYGMIEVKLISEKEEKDFTVRKFELCQESNYVNLATGNADKLFVTQYHYKAWPESTKPSNSSSLLELLNQLLKTQKLSGNKAITVMCNNGIDRTGAFICIYSQLERVKVEGIADVFQFVKASRFNRPGLVQSVDNYIFCHEVLLDFLNSFDQYENFK